MKAVRKLLLITDIKLKIWQWGEEKKKKQRKLYSVSFRLISKKEGTKKKKQQKKKNHPLPTRLFPPLLSPNLTFTSTFFCFIYISLSIFFWLNPLTIPLLQLLCFLLLLFFFFATHFLLIIFTPIFTLNFLLLLLTPFSFLRKYFLLILDQLPPLMSDAGTDAFHRRRHRETYFCDGSTIYNEWLNDRKYSWWRIPQVLFTYIKGKRIR